MSEEISNNPESVVEESSAPVDTTSQGATVDASGGGDPATPSYEPNFKFKVMDKEHEIPEAFRAIIKDQDSEKMAREIFEKAYGLDHVKPKYDSLKTQYESILNEYNPIKKDLEILSTLLEKQDVGGIAAALGLTDQQIVQYAIDRIEYQQLPPEKKQAMDAQRQQSFEYYKTQQELNQLKAQKAEGELNNTYNELVAAVQSPHIQSIAETFNARAGKQNAFEQAVVAHAQAHFALTKKDLSVSEAVESFIRTFGLQAASQPATPAPAAHASAPAGQRQPTLPKSGTGTVSPVKPKVSSVADLRKLQQQAYEAQG